MNTIVLLSLLTITAQVDYPILAIKHVRNDDLHRTIWPEVFDPIHHMPSDLVIIHPDGVEEILVAGNGTDAILDPKTLDGVNVYFVRMPNCLVKNKQRRSNGGGMPIEGADIFSINVATRVITQWTDQTDIPLKGLFPGDAPNFKYGVFNMGPQPLPDGRLVYSSSRRRLWPTKNFTAPCMQLHVRHPDGRIECITPMSQGSALHPELLRDGRIAFASYESMGKRDKRLWSLWHIDPDGMNWSVLISAYNPPSSKIGSPTAYHFHTQRTSGEIVSTEYYGLNNNGFGTIRGLDEFPTFQPGTVHVHDGWHFDGKKRYSQHIFTPSRFRNLTPWSHARDWESTLKIWAPDDLKYETIDGDYLGKVTHPSAAPDNAILLIHSDGPVAEFVRAVKLPAMHGEIRILKKDVANDPDDLIPIRKEELANYSQPRALVPFKAIYGIDPIAKPDKVDHTKTYGVFGSSDAFQGQWKFGLDSGSTGEPKSLLILGAEPNIAKTYSVDHRGEKFSSGERGWRNGLNERLRILGEYMFDEEDRPENDKSFRVKVPADIAFTVAIRGTDGRFLTCGQSWKQVRPGAREVNCGGCHNHSGEAISTEGKYAFRDEYILKDYTGEWRIPEFNKDVLPIFKANCMECHGPPDEEAGTMARLVLTSFETFSGNELYSTLRAGKSALSHRLHGENGLEQMPLGGPPLSAKDIQTIDEWIDMGGLVDDGKGAAFDVFTQVANPNPIDEAIPLDGSTPDPDPNPDPDPDPDPNDEIAELEARIAKLELALEKCLAEIATLNKIMTDAIEILSREE